MPARSGSVFSGRDAEPVGDSELPGLFATLAPVPEPILLAVSGGPDSTALMGLAARWASRVGRSDLAVATVDHGLRPASREEADGVGRAARALGLPHHRLAWTRLDRAPVSQARAREARYRLLDELALALGGATLVTAHTRDDQAETLLLRMAAGSGPSGLAGMRPVTRRGPIAHHRPFLSVPKARLVAACRAHGWAYVTDPTNADPRHARPRWRALLPALAAEGLDSARIGRLADRLARADDALDRMAEAALEEARDAAAASPSPLRGGRTRAQREPGGGGAADVASAPPSATSASDAASLEGESNVSLAKLDFGQLATQPNEIVIRALALALPPRARLRLERLETAASSLLAARAAGAPLRLTLAGSLLALDRAGTLTIAPEPPRSRGRPVRAAVRAAELRESVRTGR